MTVSQATSSQPAAYTTPYKAADIRERLRDIDMFFQGDDRVHETMNRVARQFDAAGIPYAVVGGMAVNAHGHQRTTGDVDFLLTSASFHGFLQIVSSGGFTGVSGKPRRYLDPVTGITFDIHITGMHPGNGALGPVAFPDPARVSDVIRGNQYINLITLVQLKLAARRYQDFGDVVNLIGVHNLDESFQEKLSPSVRGDYIECLEEKRREDEYEARQDEQFEQKIREATGETPPPASGT